MDYATYQQFIKDYSDSFQLDKQTAIDTQVMGLMGECGEVIECLKKEVRDGKLDVPKLIGELGDILAYLSMVADKNDVSFSKLDDEVSLDFQASYTNVDHCKRLYSAIGHIIHHVSANEVFWVFSVLKSIAKDKNLDMESIRDSNYRKLLKRWDEGKQRGWGDFR